MAEYSDEVKTLAETLKSSGLAASMPDALEKAESMIGRKEVKQEEAVKEELPEKKIDAGQTILGETKETEEKEVKQIEEEMKKEEVFTNNPGNEAKDESSQKKVDYSREKKVDLSEVFNVNK